MLPMPVRSSYSSPPSLVSMTEYVWRVLHHGQMDFDFALSQMFDLLTHPAEVYKTTSIRKQIKNQWARDDPAFVVILLALMTVASLAWLIGFGPQSFVHGVVFVLSNLLVQFLLVGVVLSSLIRLYANSSMRVHRLHAIDQSIELLYSFDIHCNAFFPSAFCMLYCVQYFLTPIILQSGFIPLLLGNSLYLLTFIIYVYITFLGYAALPFIERPERLLYPITVACGIYVLTLLMQINIAHYMLSIYFGQRDYGSGSEGPWLDPLHAPLGNHTHLLEARLENATRLSEQA